MNQDKKQILDMVSQGTISAEDAARLIEALGENEEREQTMVRANATRMKGKKLRVLVVGVEEGKKLNVNVSVPLVLARYADNIITNCVPETVNNEIKGKGIDLRSLNISEIIDTFEELEEDIVNVDIKQEDEDTDLKVRVYVE